MRLRELTVDELVLVSGGYESDTSDSGGVCTASDPNGLSLGYSMADANAGLIGNEPNPVGDFIAGFNNCQLGIMGGAIAGSGSGPSGVALGSLGGAVAGGCFGSGNPDPVSHGPAG